MEIKQEVFKQLDEYKRSIPNTRWMQQVMLRNFQKIDDGKKYADYGYKFHHHVGKNRWQKYDWDEFVTLSRLPREQARRIFSLSIPLCLYKSFGEDTSKTTSHFNTHGDNGGPVYLTTSKGLNEILSICKKNRIITWQGKHELCDLEEEVEGQTIPVTWELGFEDRDGYIRVPTILFLPLDDTFEVIPEHSVTKYRTVEHQKGESSAFARDYKEQVITREVISYDSRQHWLCGEHARELLDKPQKPEKGEKILYHKFGEPVTIYNPKWVGETK